MSVSAHTDSRSLLSRLLAVLLVAAAVSLCVLVKYPNFVPWYADLEKPSFTPSNTVFCWVWTVLYLMMAFAFGRILSLPSEMPGRRLAVLFAVAQLGLNVLWSFLFFGAHSPLMGLFVIVPQWLLTVATVASFRPLDRLAAVAMAPLIVWVAFVALLNLLICWMN
jgi:translocator protein